MVEAGAGRGCELLKTKTNPEARRENQYCISVQRGDLDNHLRDFLPPLEEDDE